MKSIWNWPKLLLKVCLFCMASQSSFGQSDNYWSWNSNTHSTLLAGAVVGGLSGPSSIFYNPALINHENLPSLSVSANLLSFQFYKVENLAGDNLNADDFLFKVQPRFISYVLPTANKRLGIQFALMSPSSESIAYAAQYETELDLIKRTAGLETYNGYLSYNRQFDDTWGGVGISYELSDRLYVGSSMFVSYKSMDLVSFQSAEAFQMSDSVSVGDNLHPRYISTSGSEEDFSYWYYSAIFKIGLQYTLKNERLSLGLNMTMPNIPLYGEADVRKRFYRSNIYDNTTGDFVTNENTLGVQEQSSVRVKSPFSVAFGGAYYFKKKTNVLLFTAEYFSPVDAYNLVDSDQQADWLPGPVDQNLTEQSFMTYSSRARPVTNLAIGYKNVISEKLAFLGGVRTDFTNGNQEDKRYVDGNFGVNQIHMNKWHISSGFLVEIGRFKVLTGLQYTYARAQDVLQATNYTDPVEYNPISGRSLDGTRERAASAALNELTLFFGLSISGK